MANDPGVGGRTTTPSSADAHRRLRRSRRKVIALGAIMILTSVVVIVALTALAFSSDQQGWRDESRVLQTHGTVVDEVSGSGSCKGADYDTLVEWTQDDEIRSAWTATCRSGPEVGDRVDLWVRDDGEITLRSPSSTVFLMVVGILFFLGMIVISVFATRAGLRGLVRQSAAAEAPKATD